MRSGSHRQALSCELRNPELKVKPKADKKKRLRGSVCKEAFYSYCGVRGHHASFYKTSFNPAGRGVSVGTGGSPAPESRMRPRTRLWG